MLGHDADGFAASRRCRQSTSRACCALAHESTSGGCAMWRIRSVIAPWDSVIAVTSAGEPVVSARPCGSARRPAGRGRSPRRWRARAVAEAASRSGVLGLGSLGGERRDARLDREPGVAGVAPVREQLSAPGGRRWRASATNVPPIRPRTATRWPDWTSAVSAWRSVERAIPSSSQRSRSAGRRRPAPAARLDRGASAPTSPRTRWSIEPARRACRRSQPFEAPHPFPVGDGGLERGELDIGVVQVVRGSTSSPNAARATSEAANSSPGREQRRRHVRLVRHVGVPRASAPRAPARRPARAARRRSSR